MRVSPWHRRVLRAFLLLAWLQVTTGCPAAVADPAPDAVPHAAPDAANHPAVAEERFYRMTFDGRPAGWVVERTTTSRGLLVTESETHMEIRRADTATVVEMWSRFEETADHEPVAGRTRQKLGSSPLETAFRFDLTDEGVEVTVEGAGAPDRRQLGLKTWRTPVEASERIARQVRRAYEKAAATGAADFTFEVRRLELLTGLEPVTARFVLQDADDPVAIDGAPRAAGRWATSESYAPLLTTLAWIDRDGVLLRSEARMMGTTVVMELTEDDPRRAEADLAAQSDHLPELLVQTFVRPDRPIPSPREVRRAVYALRVEGLDAEQLLDVIPSVGVQRAEPLSRAGGAADPAPDVGEAGALRVTVDLDRPLAAEAAAAQADASSAELASSRYVDVRSEPVQRLLADWRRSADPASGEAETAESLRRWVADHLTEKNLGTVLGTASEAARTGAGDCTEHAVLLAALLRAEGIPARVAVGLVYAERFAGERDLFAYHMWTQARLGTGPGNGAGSRWVDLDATLPPDTPFDATHILFATSPLADDGIPLLGLGAEALFGRLSVEVLEVDSGRAPGGAEPVADR